MRDRVVRVWRTLDGHWTNASWTFVDQCVVSGSNFVVGVVVARMLGAEQFGIYTLGMMAIWLVQSVNNAAIFSPMLSIAPSLVGDGEGPYFGAIFCHQLILVAVLTIGWAPAAFLLQHYGSRWLHDLAPAAVLAAAVGMVCQEFLRRYFYATRRPHLSAMNSMVSYGLQLAAIVLLYHFSMLSVTHIFLATSVTILIAIAINARNVRRLEFRSEEFAAITLRQWRLARWMLATVGFGWLSGNFFYVAAGAILGPAAVGAMRAAGLVVSASNVVMQGIDSYVPTNVGHVLRNKGRRQAWRYAGLVAVISFAAVSLFSVVICVAPHFWFSLLFGSRYQGYEWLVYAFGVLNPLNTLFIVGGGLLRVQERPQASFYSWAAMTAFTIVAATPLIHRAGLAGAVWGLVAAQAIGVLCLAAGLLYVWRGLKTLPAVS